MTTANGETSFLSLTPAGERLVGAAAFVLPPLALLGVGLGLALRGGGIAAEQWQPAAVGLVASLVALAAVGALPSVPRVAWVMLATFGALLVWSSASLLWSASRESTVENVVRLAMLAVAAAVGAAYAARARPALALSAGLALFGAAAATLMEVKLLTGDTSAFAGSRLSWPINYANADAALVWMPLAALVTFSAAQPLRPLVRGFFGSLAALALAVGLATQSRGAALALAGALIAAVAIARDRGRFALTLLAVLGSGALVADRMTTRDPSLSASAAEQRGVAALLAALVAGLLVGGLAMRDRRDRYPFGGGEARLALVAWAAVFAIGLGVFVVQNGRPDTWVADRWEEFRDVEPKPVIGVSAFGTGASNRYDYWRVAWRTFKAEPVEGVGSGAFSVPWFRSRSLNENVADAHSWQAAASAETGIVGLALMAAVLLLPLAAIRSARQARGAWPIATVALGGASVYFVLHASVDWLLRVPGVAIPAFVALGALATGGKAVPLELASLRERLGLVAAVLVVAALVVPAYISTADLSRAQADAETSNERALDKLDWAARVNPFAVEPLVVRAALLGSSGDYAGAAEAAEDATERGPDNWTAWLALAEAEHLWGDNAAAEAAFERAAALNPRVPQLAR
jgi:hypothetical protein